MMSSRLKIGKDWFAERKWKPFPFQLEAWQTYLDGHHGLVNAPTGSGKTYSLIVPILLEFMRDHPGELKGDGLQAIWITPIRALSKEIELSAGRAI
ncbi:MAG TPA: DEAD/DEAH box helicase, partial [Chryseolinea sp.]|nr:DEAD/DEAH box helicase [Chryseolinea sp.]